MPRSSASICAGAPRCPIASPSWRSSPPRGSGGRNTNGTRTRRWPRKAAFRMTRSRRSAAAKPRISRNRTKPWSIASAPNCSTTQRLSDASFDEAVATLGETGPRRSDRDHRLLHLDREYPERLSGSRARRRNTAFRRIATHAACGSPRSSNCASRRAKAGGSGSCSPSTIRAWSSSSQANSASWSEAPVSPTVAARRSISLWRGFSSRMRLAVGVELAMLLQQPLEVHVHVALVGDQTDRAVGQPLGAAHVLDRVAERQLEDRDQAGELGRRRRLFRLGCSSAAAILSRSTPPRVADLNGFSL